MHLPQPGEHRAERGARLYLARSYFYVSTRYYLEEAGWPGDERRQPAPVGERAVRAVALRRPVSQKERLRNGAVYALQHNRNQFIDHPEFAALLFDSLATVGVGPRERITIGLDAAAPNPFSNAATVRFRIAERSRVALEVFDLQGRRVRTLAGGEPLEAGAHSATWDGRDDAEAPAGPGLYFARLQAGTFTGTTRMVRVRLRRPWVCIATHLYNCFNFPQVLRRSEVATS